MLALFLHVLALLVDGATSSRSHASLSVITLPHGHEELVRDSRTGSVLAIIHCDNCVFGVHV